MGRLSKGDHELIQSEIEARTEALGPVPTAESLRQQGYVENAGLNRILDAIAAAGKIATLVIAEVIQSLAAIIIAIVFAILEYQRVQRGAVALGQPDLSAGLIAFAVVTANVVHPIYSLRTKKRTQKVGTFRGWLEEAWRRLWGLPTVKDVDQHHNPALDTAAFILTWATILLAVYDLLGPLLGQIFAGQFVKPIPILGMELFMGFGLSLAGVLFLQAAAHEVGVRTLTDRPVRLADIVEREREKWLAQQAEIRKVVIEEVAEAKRLLLTESTRTLQLSETTRTMDMRQKPVRRKRSDGGSDSPETVQADKAGLVPTEGIDMSLTASARVRKYYEMFPDSIDMSVRVLSEMLKVGKSTVSSVRAEIMAEREE